jgi:sulfide:quinone oxidoreductase
VEAILALRELAEGTLRVELLSPSRDFIYRPLAVAEPFGLGAPRRFDLATLTAGVGASYRVDGLASVDPERRRIRTRAGEELDFDALVIATGARVREALPGAITFWGTGDAEPFRAVLKDLETGAARKVVFCLPGRGTWPLPLYELALLTTRVLAQCARDKPQLTIATREATPLELFGARASAAVRELLEERGICLRCNCYPAGVDGDGLQLVPRGHLAADRVIATARLEGRFLEGVPHDGEGFIPTDTFGRVQGLQDARVYAAGDVTSFPVKQGGLGAQQADATAELIAAEAGAPVDPKPFRPVLRGLLLTGSEPSYLRAEITGGRGETSVASHQPLWWPPEKIAGRYLAPHLAWLGRAKLPPRPSTLGQRLPVEVELRR